MHASESLNAQSNLFPCYSHGQRWVACNFRRHTLSFSISSKFANCFRDTMVSHGRSQPFALHAEKLRLSGIRGSESNNVFSCHWNVISRSFYFYRKSSERPDMGQRFLARFPAFYVSRDKTGCPEIRLLIFVFHEASLRVSLTHCS